MRRLGSDTNRPVYSEDEVRGRGRGRGGLRVRGTAKGLPLTL